jgi:hypothetical protein
MSDFYGNQLKSVIKFDEAGEIGMLKLFFSGALQVSDDPDEEFYWEEVNILVIIY